MKRCSVTLAMLLSVMGLLGVGGCQTGDLGTTNVAGDITTMIDASPEQIASAGERVLTEMSFLDVSGVSTSIDGRVRAKTAHDQAVTIKIKSQGKNISKVAIRVGALGDEATSMRILEELRAALGGDDS